MDAERTDRADLWWLPVGAGGVIVAHTSRWWELMSAWRDHRTPLQLVHAALEVLTGGERYVIEMTPQWGQPRTASGVVATGPVGRPALGRFRMFRYVVRAWPNGVLPDRAYAVAAPTSIPLGRTQAQGLLDTLPDVPLHTWGRAVPPSTDMWNSNSLIAWALRRAGVDAGTLAPPAGCRAPGWAAGLAAGTRQRRGCREVATRNLRRTAHATDSAARH